MFFLITFQEFLTEVGKQLCFAQGFRPKPQMFDLKFLI